MPSESWSLREDRGSVSRLCLCWPGHRGTSELGVRGVCFMLTREMEASQCWAPWRQMVKLSHGCHQSTSSQSLFFCFHFVTSCFSKGNPESPSSEFYDEDELPHASSLSSCCPSFPSLLCALPTDSSFSAAVLLSCPPSLYLLILAFVLLSDLSALLQHVLYFNFCSVFLSETRWLFPLLSLLACCSDASSISLEEGLVLKVYLKVSVKVPNILLLPGF